MKHLKNVAVLSTAVALLSLGGLASAQNSTIDMGNGMYFHSDGTTTTDMGNGMYFHSDGTSTTDMGNGMYFHSDGTSTFVWD